MHAIHKGRGDCGEDLEADAFEAFIDHQIIDCSWGRKLGQELATSGAIWHDDSGLSIVFEFDAEIFELCTFYSILFLKNRSSRLSG